MARGRRRKPSFLENLSAVFIAAVALVSLALTFALQIEFIDAVRLAIVGVASLLSVYVLSLGMMIARERVARITGASSRAHSRKGRSARVPRGLVRRIDRRAGKRIRHHGAFLSRERARCASGQVLGRVDRAAWMRAQDKFIDDVLLEGVNPMHAKAMKRRSGLISAWRRRMDAAANEIERARADAGRGLDFRPGMDGFEYEAFCARILTEAGWKVWNKGDTGDQGVDLVAERKGLTVTIQCKRYRGSVGNKAVQEIFAGKLTVSATAYAAVVSNAHYTRSARELADATHVYLLHHNDLPRLEEILSSGASVLKAAA